jgi:hypothetical protein
VDDCDYQAAHIPHIRWSSCSAVSRCIGYHFDLFSLSALIIAARFGRGLCPSPYSAGISGLARSRGFSLGLSSCSGG